ncbi:hypothetical protein ACSFA3_22095 [Variovorax sp. RHLX14]|uniref:hypothetical protein n=1 Tax=Variovorax sp. RHLX14 TaxID=1259731 RepID=UPI003F45BDEE
MNIKSWNRFLSTALQVSPEIMGRSHEFNFEGAEIKIEIPSKERASDQVRDIVAEVGTRWSRNNEPVNYRILQIDVDVCLGICIDLPSEILKQSANAYELIAEEKRQELDEISQKHGRIAERAFEYWISVVQWVADDYRIGRTSSSTYHSGWSTRLEEINSEKSIWIETVYVFLSGYTTIDIDKWMEIQSRTKNSEYPPISIVLKNEAKHFFDLGDYRRSLMDIAIACETYLRSSVLASLPENLSPMARDQIDKSNIAQYTNHLFPELLDAQEIIKYKSIKSDINSLFAKRNDLFHRGDANAATHDGCQKFLGVLQNLMEIKKLE